MAKLEAILSADTSHFDRGLDKSEKKMGAFGSAVKVGALGAGAAIGVGLFKAAKLGFGEFQQGQLVAAQTAAVLKSTGGVAHVTAKQIDGLATSLMKKSGVDDEVIASGENMLLTFKNVRNEAGRGNNIFTQATKAALDLSVATGKDLTSANVMLGKALNDPVKGISALTRVGVTFTESQRDQIKALTASGDAMGAQKIILKELGSEFGGSAAAAGKTFGGQINILKESFSNLAGEGVGKLMPKLAEFGGWLTETAVPRLRDFVHGLTGNDSVKTAFGAVRSFLVDSFFPTIQKIGELFGDVMAAVKRVLDAKKEEIATIIGGIKTIMEGIYLVIREVVIPALKLLFKKGGPFDIAFGLAIDIIAGVVTTITGIVDAFKTVKNWVEKNWGTISSIIEHSPMALVLKGMATAVGLVVDGFKWLIENVSKLKLPSVPGWLDPRNIGDPRDSTLGAGVGGLMGASPVMAPFAAAAAGFGLHVTSGLRPGAVTAHGTPSDHAIGKALDVADGPASMAAFFKSLIGNRAVKQAFYDPLGSIFSGAWSSYREGGHSDHVHVATFDKGGWLAPFSKTLAINNTRHWEPVGPPGAGTVVHVHFSNHGVLGSEREVIAWIQSAFKRNARRGGQAF